MKILSRYIASEFLKALLFAALAFLLIYIVVDVFEKMDRFLDHHVLLQHVLLYYLYQVPYTTVLILPVAVLLASLFSIGQLARNHELVAMKSSGLSLYRILAPLFGLGFLLSLMVLVMGEVAIPYFNQQKFKAESRYIDKVPPIDWTNRTNVFYRGTQGRMYYIQHFDGKNKALTDVVIYEFNPEGKLVKRIDAVQAAWGNDRWTFRQGYLRTFDLQGNELTPQHFETLTLPDLRETPQDFQREDKDPQSMGFFELYDYISRVRRGGGEAQKETVDLYLKISFPFANLIIILFGAPLASNPRRSGAAFGFGVSLMICFLYWGFVQLGRALGHHGTLNPFLSAWLANLVFGSIGGVLLWKTPK